MHPSRVHTNQIQKVLLFTQVWKVPALGQKWRGPAPNTTSVELSSDVRFNFVLDLLYFKALVRVCMSVPWLNLPSIYGSLRVSYLRRQSAKFMAVLLKTSSSWMFFLMTVPWRKLKWGCFQLQCLTFNVIPKLTLQTCILLSSLCYGLFIVVEKMQLWDTLSCGFWNDPHKFWWKLGDAW